MIISDLEFFLVEIPCPRVGFPVRSVIVRVATPNGREGWGEMPLNWRADELQPRRDHLLPALTGRSVFDIEDLVRLEELRDPALCLGIETACWDLIGKLTGYPICYFFGGEYRHRIPLVARLYGSVPEEITATSIELHNQGYHRQVLPLSGKIDDDRRLVRMIVDSLGQRIELRLDGQCRYSKDDALLLCNEWEEWGIAFIIDPLESNEIADLWILQNQTVLPIGVRRAIRSASDILSVRQGNHSLFLVIEPSRIGSLHQARKCAAVAEAAGIRVSLATTPSLGILSATTLQLAAALPAFSNGNEGIVFRPQDDILRDRDTFDISDGLILLPHGPGIGAEIDRAKIDRYSVS